jgi:hypothetical protein
MIGTTSFMWQLLTRYINLAFLRASTNRNNAKQVETDIH